MLKPLWLALAALGLWASLIPQVTYPSASSGEPSDQILVAWPGWGVQQDLGPLSGTVGTFHVWVSAEPRGDHVTVWASLVDASTREVLRQTSVNAAPDSVTVHRTLAFPTYVVPKGQRLLLQLQVAEFEQNYAIYRLSAPKSGLNNVAVNGVPDVGDGPLAFAHTISGSGLRTAILGDQSARIRLVLASMLTVLSILAHPCFSLRLRRAKASVRRLFWHAPFRGSRFVGSGDESAIEHSSSRLNRVFGVPWYPWPAVTVPILHFLANNTLHFVVVDAFIPLIVALAFATGSMVALRLLLRDWHLSAAATAVILVVFFGYGYLARAIDDRVDERVLFAGTVVLGVLAIVGIAQAIGLLARWTQFLNSLSAVLFLFSVLSLPWDTLVSLVRASDSKSVESSDLVSHLLPSGMPEAGGRRPDIYYIILDEYTRNDALGEFDNSDFLSELERRGFYVASKATSNYTKSIRSIPSSLNMSYLDELGLRSPGTDLDLIHVGHYNALAAILKSLGYTYVHLESGHPLTSRAPLADYLVTFRPSGVEVVQEEESRLRPVEGMMSWKFSCELAQTTLLWPAVRHCFLADTDAPYVWWSPVRALRMFEFLTEPSDIQSPKFVFAHILKPHSPATFDRYGNYVVGESIHDEFNNRHDPSVPNAYVGQLIFVNSLALKMIDSIIQNSTSEPIIVVAGDHGRHVDRYTRYLVLAAFHLPDGGRNAVYSSISSVNHFRAILDYYFDLGIDLLDDREL